jgi:hypothetical protein
VNKPVVKKLKKILFWWKVNFHDQNSRLQGLSLITESKFEKLEVINLLKEKQLLRWKVYFHDQHYMSSNTKSKLWSVFKAKL